MNVGHHVRRRPGLAWVLIVTALTVVVSLAGLSPRIRLPFVLTFFLTVPGFLILDLRQPSDVAAKVAMGIASSVSFYIVAVSVALLGSISWIAGVGVVFVGGLVAWLYARRRIESQPQPTTGPPTGVDAGPAAPDPGMAGRPDS
jgi:hypothetical protein